MLFGTAFRIMKIALARSEFFETKRLEHAALRKKKMSVMVRGNG